MGGRIYRRYIARTSAPAFCQVLDYLLVRERQGGTINAFASEHDGVYCCALHDYFYGAIIDMAYGLFCDPEFMASLGETSKLEPYSYTMPIGTRFLRLGTGVFTQCAPKCPYRKQLADFLIVLMLSVAFLHEESHVVSGHVGALKLLTKQLQLDEQSMVHGAAVPMMVSQILEQEADMVAIFNLSLPMWRTTIEKNYARSTGLTSSDMMTLRWLASAFVGSLLLRTTGRPCLTSINGERIRIRTFGRASWQLRPSSSSRCWVRSTSCRTAM
jgi:hypothetical protein